MITITNKNIYYSEFPMSTSPSMDKVDIVNPEDILSFLADNVELSESLKFKRLFDIVSYNIDKFNEIFYSSLGGYNLGPFLQEIENNPTEKFQSDYLELHWACDRYEDELTIVPSLHGYCIEENEHYAMDFVSLNNIKDYIIKLNEEVKIFDYKDFNENKDYKQSFIGNKSFTLFDLYHGIFSEISFHGGPQDKKERLSELEESISEIDTENLDETNTRSWESFEDMVDEFEAKDGYLVKYKELRDRVDKERMSNNKNLDKIKNCLLEKLKIYDLIENSDIELDKYYKKLTDIEYNLQLLYGEEEDKSFHKFWETPKCTCPKIDNLENYPSDKPFFDKKCPIHKNI